MPRVFFFFAKGFICFFCKFVFGSFEIKNCKLLSSFFKGVCVFLSGVRFFQRFFFVLKGLVCFFFQR